jgi:tRNA pseudouridine32 synthase/23S rRNA pseudouridine746 synthase/23S rRNA pseudouridine1911/1915/1917 synthase
MQNKKPFKQPPKKFHPKGITILYEDWDILVVEKTAGLLTISSAHVREQTAYYLLTDYVRKGNSKSKNRLFIVHRLDRDTSGLLVFAKTEKAKLFLQAEWSTFEKKYYAVVQGVLEKKEAVLSNYLAENTAHKMYLVGDPKKGKLAKTEYRVCKESTKYSLLEIKLLTGRKNQIRVQFAATGHPVAGDKKYGERQKGVKRLCLHSFSLRLVHPFSKEEMSFTSKRPTYFDSLLRH